MDNGQLTMNAGKVMGCLLRSMYDAAYVACVIPPT